MLFQANLPAVVSSSNAFASRLGVIDCLHSPSIGHTLTSAQSFVGVAARAPVKNHAAIRGRATTKLSTISVAQVCARDT